jgi:CheY-like chemotaxis protein
MPGFRLKVLVADDATAIHTVFANIAANSPIPFDLVTARNGRECMNALTSGRIHVAFIDVNMPEMSGMDAVDSARRIGTKTFISLVSTSANTRRLQLARQLKVYDLLLKPFTPDDVIAVLQTYGACSPTASSTSTRPRRVTAKRPSPIARTPGSTWSSSTATCRASTAWRRCRACARAIRT